jgi:hypothetical protein
VPVLGNWLGIGWKPIYKKKKKTTFLNPLHTYIKHKGITGYRGSFPWIKRPGHEVDHSPPSNAEVNNERSYTSTPPTPSWCNGMSHIQIAILQWQETTQTNDKMNTEEYKFWSSTLQNVLQPPSATLGLDWMQVVGLSLWVSKAELSDARIHCRYN